MSNPYRLEYIHLNKIGVFNNTRIEFPERPSTSNTEHDEQRAEIHLFTGPNGCGKSTLLYALANIFHEEDVSKLIQERFHNSESGVNYRFNDSFGEYSIYENATKKVFLTIGPDYVQDVISFSKNNVKNNKIINFLFAVFAYSGQRVIHAAPITGIQEITNSPFENAVSFDTTIRSHLLLQWIANNRTKALIARSENNTAAAARYDLSQVRISEFIQEICDLDIKFQMQHFPQLSVKIIVDNKDVPFNTLPDGLKSILSWTIDLATRLEMIPWEVERDVFTQPMILFLDEIDIHLHPKWQRRVLPAIQKLLPNAQIFATTHSPFVVGSVADAWVYRLPEKPDPKAMEQVTIVGEPSGAGKSYRLILKELFNVEGEFDVETEKLLDAFYLERSAFPNDRSRKPELQKLAKRIAQISFEAGLIVSQEIRQLERMTGEVIRLA
ncbi:MAG: AAA family ATPase [Magnetococcales bacterium]|nr:AAA family ATPase [Magnetococcales bacterium]